MIFARTAPKRQALPSKEGIHKKLKFTVGMPPKNFHKNLKWLMLIISLVMAIDMGIIFLSPIFKVKNILCTADKFACDAAITGSLSRDLNQNLLFLNTSSNKQEILYSYPQIAEVVIRRQLPDTLNVSLTLRQPVAVIEDKLQRRFLVDKNQMIYAEGNQEGLPVIKTQEAVVLGEIAVSQEMGAVLRLVQILQESSLTVKSITIISQEYLELALESGDTVYFNAQKDIAKEVDTLNYIFQHNTPNGGKKTQIIDLRFDDPIVK
jgi:cell division septal protein FtsQ